MAPHTTTGLGVKLAPNHIAAVAQPSATAVPSLFTGLDQGDIAEIMAAAVIRRLAARQTIFRDEDPGTHLFLLKAGSVDLYRVTQEGQQVLIMRFSPGDTVGFVSLLSKPMGYIGTAEAVGETEVYVWEHPRVRHFAQKHPRLAENALRIGLEYIRLYSDRHLALVSDNAEDRLRRTLSQLELRAGHRHGRGLEVDITNERLASLADIGYYTASRLLNKWKRKGAVVKSRGKVVVVRPERMLDQQPYRMLHRLHS